MEIFSDWGAYLLSRWGHYLAGVTWIGLLYYFNFVQAPAFVQFEPAGRNEATAKLVPRAMWWFRWGAVLTLLTGLLILAFNPEIASLGEYMKSPSGISVSTGILLAVVMFANVWLIIWPAQKQAITDAQHRLAGGPPDPALARVARRSACASRTNTLLSVPMLLFMGATSHFFAHVDFVTSGGGDRALYWSVVIVLVAVVEGVGIAAPSASRPLAWHLDDHRNTIIGGFVLSVVLYLLWELIF